MTKVSRYKMDSKLQQKLINNFWTLVGGLNKKDAEVFLGRLFTPTEVVMFAKRLETLKRVREKEPYVDIQFHLKLTNTTIGKRSNILHRANKRFLSIFARFT